MSFHWRSGVGNACLETGASLLVTYFEPEMDADDAAVDDVFFYYGTTFQGRDGAAPSSKNPLMYSKTRAMYQLRSR